MARGAARSLSWKLAWERAAPNGTRLDTTTPAALLCLVSQVHNPVAVVAAWTYPALRMVYVAAYVANLPPLRSLCRAGAMVCTGILYREGLKAVLAAG